MSAVSSNNRAYGGSAEVTNSRIVTGSETLGGISRTEHAGQRSICTAAQIRGDIRRSGSSRPCAARFQRPLVLGTIDLAKVVDTSIFLRGGARPNKIRDRDGSQEADDRHNDHDFYEREARFTGGLTFHITYFTFLIAA